MKQAEYIGEVLEDGHLSLPEAVRKELALQPAAQVRVTIAVPEAGKGEVKDAWELFKTMGQDAIPGQLSNPSSDHDRYLYNKEES